jgi:raffinose/stachyose/melibiose transport system substrate-binding protein
MLALVAASLTAASLSACGTQDNTGGGGDATDGEAVTLTFWHNATTGDGKAFWEKQAADFHAANPNVTIEITPVQNEDFDGKLQNAMNSGDAPDVFLQRGGGKMQDMIAAGQVMDITDSITAETKAAVSEGMLAGKSFEGKIYGMPVAVLPGGLFYSKDLFEQAGITSTPTTMDELNAAIAKLKTLKGVAPVALGAKDAWPAAHWFYFFSIRECPSAVIDETAKTKTFNNDCWTKAGNDLKAFADTKPFNDGFLTTSAQQGAGSSAGLLANHKAAMELMGAWDPGVIASLTPDEKPLADLAWFPFPDMPGTEGAAKAIMGGVDGFSCSASAPKEACTAFLNWMVKKDVQEAYYKAFTAPPVNKDAQAVVTEPYLISIMEALNSATYTTDWLDTILGQNVGNALNTGVVDLLAGKGDVAGIIQAANDAAAKE